MQYFFIAHIEADSITQIVCLISLGGRQSCFIGNKIIGKPNELFRKSKKHREAAISTHQTPDQEKKKLQLLLNTDK